MSQRNEAQISNSPSHFAKSHSRACQGPSFQLSIFYKCRILSAGETYVEYLLEGHFHVFFRHGAPVALSRLALFSNVP